MRQIADFPDYYITETGEVYRLSGTLTKRIKAYPDKFGYLNVNLFSNGKKFGKRVHRLVALVYLQNPNNLPFVCHKDDNPANNCKDNLFWGTHQDNMDDRKTKGRTKGPRGSLSGSVVVTETQVKYIRSFTYELGLYKTLATELGISPSQVRNIFLRRNWTHI